MKKLLVGAIFAFAITGGAFFIGHTTQVHAQAKDSNANNLRLSPLKTNVTINAGDAAAVTVYVQNMSDEPVNLKPITNDFQAKDEIGTPGLLLGENEFAKSRSLKKYMSVQKSVLVQPKERAAINVRISIPEGTLSGGYFGAVRFVPIDAAGNEQVNLTGSVASLILVTVPGDLVERLSLATFDIRQDEKSKTWFKTPKNLDVLLRFKNEGNVQVTPFGKVLVSKSGKTVYTAEVNNTEPAGQTLPESVRRFAIPLEKIGSFGKYTVTATIGYGSAGQTITQQKTIWIIPMVLIIGVLAGIVLLVFLVIILPKILRGYKNKVIRNSRGGRKR